VHQAALRIVAEDREAILENMPRGVKNKRCGRAFRLLKQHGGIFNHT